MKIRRISTIALSNQDHESLAAKLDDACRWVSLAAKMGSDLAVLPEYLNKYCGDGPNNPRALSMEEEALDDWQSACAVLMDCARDHRIAVTIPIITREADGYRNCFYLVNAAGECLGRYVKTYPTVGELDAGILPGKPHVPIDWDGIKVGGAICFDMNFPQLFTGQCQAGADLFLCPSFFPGGDQLSHYARTLQRPIVLSYPAWSRIIDVMGRDVVSGGYRHETLRFGYGVPIYTHDINFDTAVFHFDHNQEKLEAVLRHYGSDVSYVFDQANVCYSLSSMSPDLSIDDVIKEFGLEPSRAYLDRALARREDVVGG